MNNLKNNQIWFITGSQHLYGEATLKKVDEHSKRIAGQLSINEHVPVSVIYKPVVKSAEEIYEICQQANISKECIGIIAWMHTFSPAKMWIRGLSVLNKPLLHFHTQYNVDIPWSEIDMDFMNLNQSAHGDREFGFMLTRMRLNRKVIAGHWQDNEVVKKIGTWSRAAAGWNDWQGARFARFGDNMRNVAVTEGDKVEAELKFGYSVNTFGIGDLSNVIKDVSEKEIDVLCEEYADSYTLSENLLKGGSAHQSLRKAAKIETGLLNFLIDGNYKGFTDTFEDLHGMSQLPGIAAQRLMAKGYGFAAEGDWKTAALVRAMKVMATGLPGGNSFMEDYTYHFDPNDEMVLGAHMLEICESIADGKPTCEIHPLAIGGKEDPVRLVFNTAPGSAINVSVVDMGNRFRFIVNDVEAVAPKHALPKLPVARVLWKPLPDLKTGCTAWLLAGGAHHTCFSQNLSVDYIEDFTEMAGVEMIHIGKSTDIKSLKNELRWNEMYFAINARISTT
jgi:L-arabinose isomerase